MASPRSHRVPAGSLLVIAPPGMSPVDNLTAAGLPTSNVVTRPAVRRKFGNECANLACKAVPTRCTHHEDAVDAHIEAHASVFLAAGRTWLYEGALLTLHHLAVHVDRAHRAGLAAVALRPVRNGRLLTLEEALEANDKAPFPAPHADVEAAYGKYVLFSDAVLTGIGFDLVLEFDTDTTFELLPGDDNAHGVDTTGVVVVGDLHGCARTFLDRMLPALGTDARLSNPDVLVVSVGDIHDKGDPAGAVELIRWWLWALRTGRALMVDSNHNRKLVRHLAGHQVRVSPGLAGTLAELDAQPDAEELKAQIVASFSRLPSHLRFDDLVVVHAAMTEELLGDTSNKARGFMLHARDSRTPWEWTGSQTLVHGHEPVHRATTRRAPADPTRPGHVPGQVVNIDTGAYLGGVMTAYRHRDARIVEVEPHPVDLTGALAARSAHPVRATA